MISERERKKCFKWSLEAFFYFDIIQLTSVYITIIIKNGFLIKYVQRNNFIFLWYLFFVSSTQSIYCYYVLISHLNTLKRMTKKHKDNCLRPSVSNMCSLSFMVQSKMHLTQVIDWISCVLCTQVRSTVICR
jgi:hypothetical protein